MTRLAAVLAEHLDQPSQRHRLTAVDPKRLRCHDCDRTILLTQPSQTTSTSPSPIPGPDDPRCPQHQHEHADGCRTCAADAKADEHRSHEHQLTADVPARAAEARAQLPPRATAVRRGDHDVDPIRMAAARAEINALRAREEPADA